VLYLISKFAYQDTKSLNYKNTFTKKEKGIGFFPCQVYGFFLSISNDANR
jgi:hypothetical protein